MEVALGSVLGLTIQCARCHSHKYDPIPQEDYYRLLAAFTPAYNPQSWLQPGLREIADVSVSEKVRIKQQNAKINQQIGKKAAWQSALRKPYAERIREEKLKRVAGRDRSACRAALNTPVERRTETQKALLATYGAMLDVKPEEIQAAMTPAVRKAEDRLQQEVVELASRLRGWGIIQALYDVGSPPATYVLKRGNHEAPDKEATAGFLRVLCDSDATAITRTAPPYPGTSGRRLALVRWLTDRRSASGALVARVFVNRVWQQLFGRGIVATSENLGRSGAAPTHPELLEWLASEFVDSGWRVKPLIRRLMTSAAYRQASLLEPRPNSAAAPNVARTDPANDLLWHMRLRPIEAEAVRDSLLAVSGCLDSTQGGDPVMCGPDARDQVSIIESALRSSTGKWRRSVYLLQRHRYHLSLLETFDQPEMVGLCTRRLHAPTVAQSLTMLNDGFLVEQSAVFARRVVQETVGKGPAAWIDRAFALALCRPVKADERRWASDLLARHARRFRLAGHAETEHEALAHLCQMLLNSSEFLYLP
jgi:hypothetical protein